MDERFLWRLSENFPWQKVGELLLFAGFMGVVILLLRLLTRTIGQRWQAKTRYLLWLLVLVRLCIPVTLPIPHLTQTVVQTSVERKQMVEQVQNADGRVEITVTPYRTYVAMNNAAEEPQDEPTVLRHWVVDLQLLLPWVLLTAWLGGALVVLVGHHIGYRWYQTRLERSLVPADEGTQNRLIGRAKEMGLEEVPSLYISEKVDSPLLCGFILPKIVLPADILPHLQDVELRGIFAHELTHYRRHDLWVQLFSLVVCALYWFHPLVWLADRWMREEMELSCDEAVLTGATATERTTYGKAMLTVLQQCHRRGCPMTTGFSGRRKALKRRFENIMSTKKKTTGWGGVTLVAVLCLVAGSVVSCVVEEAPVTLEETNLASGFVFGENYAEEITVHEQVSSYTEEAVPVFVNGSWLVDTDGNPVAAIRNADGSGWLVDAVSVLEMLYPGESGTALEGSESQWSLSLFYDTNASGSWDLTQSYSATNPESWENNIRQIVHQDGVEEKTHMPLEIETVGEATNGTQLYRVWMEPEDVAWFLQAELMLYDGTGTDGYLNGMPHIGLSRYPENATVLTAEEAIEAAKTVLIAMYENTYGPYEPLYEEPETSPYPGDEVMLRWKIENLTCIGENDRYWRLSYIEDILVDKYTGDVYSHYNGMAQTYERLEPSTVNGFAFAG